MSDVFKWQSAAPKSQGMNFEKLEEQWHGLLKNNSKAYLVIRNDKIVFEKYSHGWNKNRRHSTASAAKAVVGGLSLMLAIQDGLIDIDDYACKYIPQWESDRVKSNITIRHLASHTSGLDDARDGDTPHEELAGWKGNFWRQDPVPFQIARDEAPVVFAPGTDYLYSNTGIAMLAYAVTAALGNSGYKDIRTLLWERIINPMGISRDEWSIGYGKTFELDGLKLVAAWGGGLITPGAMAKIGRLMLNKGCWEGMQLIDEAAVKRALSHSGHPFCYGMAWRINSDLKGSKLWPSLPWDSFLAIGAGGQILLVIPGRKLIVVRNGKGFDNARPKEFGDSDVDKYIGEPLMEALESAVPCPWSKKITRIEWAPASSVIRHAAGGAKRDGSDNWPMTWADDGNIYTAYGDGYGFEPSLPLKLGLGFAKISGTPADFKCENIRSSIENRGYGARGEKCSGLLMADGILYLWVRNADKNGKHSRLACSRDYSKTWEWNDWKFEQFGHILFVNYGRNYSGARDNFVYMASHDNPSAYEQASQFILMRVHKDRITDRSSYEFFVSADEKNKPLWSKEIGKRGPILEHANNCRRASISYNEGIGRYLMWQQINAAGSDTRFIGGVGIYEAPEPWGPWSTVYFSEKWDVGPGDLGCFPTKWMSEDGRTVYLAFAGNDNFCLRKAELTVNENI